MLPGRELDALIAKHLFKIRDVQMLKGFGPVYDFTGTQGTFRESVPHYSTDIKAAWEVVERVGPIWRGFEFSIRWSNSLWSIGWFEDGEGRAHTYSKSVPLGICIAALKTGVDE